MDPTTYRVVFSGKIKQGCDPNQVKKNLAKIFKLDPARPEQLAKLKKLFSGQPVVIKDKLSKPEAEKYHRVISGAGCISRMEPTLDNERRRDQRRKRGDRRSVRRSSSILPDRRTNPGRREADQPEA